MLRWNWRSQLSLIHPPSLGTEKAFLVFCAVPRGPPAAATPSPAQRGISRQQKDKQDEELHQPRWLVCLFVYLFSEPCCWKPLEDFRLQVLEILQRLASPATHLAGFLEAAWGAEEASLTYHFNRVHRRLRGCKAHRRGGEAMASPRPPSACSEQTEPCRRDDFQRSSLSLRFSGAAWAHHRAHRRELPVFRKRDFFSFLHQLTGRYQRPRLLNRVHKDIIGEKHWRASEKRPTFARTCADRRVTQHLGQSRRNPLWSFVQLQ